MDNNMYSFILLLQGIIVAAGSRSCLRTFTLVTHLTLNNGDGGGGLFPDGPPVSALGPASSSAASESSAGRGAEAGGSGGAAASNIRVGHLGLELHHQTTS